MHVSAGMNETKRSMGEILMDLRSAGCVLGIAMSASLTATAFGGAVGLDTVRVKTGLERPVFATHAPGDFDRLFVVEKRGHIELLDMNNNFATIGQFLNIDSIVGGGTSGFSEQGLLGLAFHPDFQSNGKLYVNYTNNGGNTVVSEWTVSATNPNIVDLTSERKLMQIAQPFTNHNGGWLGFGQDGYLYISTGDGGSGGDPGNRSQDITNQLLGKMLRIDVDGTGSGVFGQYAIPADNPFVGISGDDEIWAYGLRNPWRPSFDALTGDLYIADVGQSAREEISVQPASSTGGENYGWRCYEGNNNFNTGGCAPAATMVFPVHEYPRTSGISITGGYVYRGCVMPEMQGLYFFADYGSARIWTFEWNGGGGITGLVNRTTELAPSTGGAINSITSFGTDAFGEMYICDQGSSSANGELFKIIPAGGTGSGSCCPGDADGDGDVDFDDLNEVLTNWDTASTVGDVFPFPTGDGQVNFNDLNDVLSNWGDVCN